MFYLKLLQFRCYLNTGTYIILFSHYHKNVFWVSYCFVRCKLLQNYRFFGQIWCFLALVRHLIIWIIIRFIIFPNLCYLLCYLRWDKWIKIIVQFDWLCCLYAIWWLLLLGVRLYSAEPVLDYMFILLHKIMPNPIFHHFLDMWWIHRCSYTKSSLNGYF